MHRIFIIAAAALAVAGCSSSPEGVEAYCSTVERTATAMAGTDVATKRPAMIELRDAAPAEIRGYWDDYVADETELAQRDLARERIAAFEAEHC